MVDLIRMCFVHRIPVFLFLLLEIILRISEYYYSINSRGYIVRSVFWVFNLLSLFSYIGASKIKSTNSESNRCSYCSICGDNIDMLEYHSFLVQNCIGRCNYKSFFLFHLYRSLTSIFSLLILLLTRFSVSFVVLCILHYNLIILALSFSFFNETMDNLLKNQTRIESLNEIKRKNCSKLLNKVFVSQYGKPKRIDNIKVRFGSNIILWLLPLPVPYQTEIHNHGYISLETLTIELLQ